MPLEQLELETGLNKVDFAIVLLQTWQPLEGYYLAFSGGACSVVTKDLLIKSGCKFDAHYCVSPIDPPQIYEFIKTHHPDVHWDFHARGFWKLVEIHGLPTRQRRWCCKFIKEAGGEGRIVVLGNRIAESARRRHQCFVQSPSEQQKQFQKANKTFIRPILQFSNYDLWQYIRENNLPYCSLYDEGAIRKGYGEGLFKRLGCVLCPFAKSRKLEEQYFPKIVGNWKRACNRIIENRKASHYLSKRGKPFRYQYETGEELYQWWIER
jgi:phosphoadenosine phosphosulfate reductase